ERRLGCSRARAASRGAGKAYHRCRIKRAAEAECVAVVTQRRACLVAEPNTQLATELVIRDDDPRFNQYLPHSRVDLADDATNFLELARDIGDEEDVGGRIDEGGAPSR